MGRFRFTEDGRRFALRLMLALNDHRDAIDRILGERLERWDLVRTSTAVRAILRLSVLEMLVISESPERVILSEAIRLAERYGEEGAGAFVNGVLDAAARQIRPGRLDSKEEPDNAQDRAD